jgi:hypothetical protein
MTVGATVSKGLLDTRVSEASRALLSALHLVARVDDWLKDHPGYDISSELVADFGYTPDEAYLLQDTFTMLAGIRETHADALDNARKLTGLE